MLCRGSCGSGWSAPAGIKVEGGSVGFQIGGSETDVIMLVMNKGGAEKLLSSKFTLGADVSVAAGPVGRASSAKTDLKMRAEILSYSRARGVFAGIALDGATLRPDDDSNVELYPTKPSNKEIVMGKTEAPAAASQLIAALNRYSAQKKLTNKGPIDRRIDLTRAWVSMESLDTSFQPRVLDSRQYSYHRFPQWLGTRPASAQRTS